MRRWLVIACVGCSDPSVQPDAGVLPDARTAVLSITPGGFYFGNHEVGTDQLPPPLTVSVKNISTQPVDLTAIGIAGPAAADFSITDNGCGASLAPDEACGLTLVFEAKGGDLRSAQLDVTTADETVSAPISGTGIVRGLKLLFDPPSRNLGDIPAGTTSASVTFGVLNEAVATTFSASITGEDADSFEIVSTTCNAAIPLHGTCEAVVAMTPAWTGQHVASLQIAAGTSGSWSAGLIGASTTPIVATPHAGNFGSMLVGQPEAPAQVTFTVKNTASSTTGTLTPTLSGPGASSYAIDSTDCTTLVPDATCTVVVSLAATTRGSKIADLVVTDGTSSVAARSSLVGSAYTVFITTSPQFTATTVAQSSTKTLTIANASDRATGAVTVGVTGTEYAITNTSTCASGIAAHDSCTVQVSFSPSATGQRTATLQASASPGSTHSVTLTGTGQ